MKDYVIVTGYKDMCFETDKKEEVDFMKLSCLTRNSGADSIGYLPMQMTYMGKDKVKIQQCIKEVPGLYEAEYSMVPGKNNKPSLQIVGFNFVNGLDIASLFNVKKVS
jgi:hypothetical protein